MSRFKEELENRKKISQDAILKYLPKEEGLQKKLIEASNYSVLAGGKRIRPILMLSSFWAFGGKGECIYPFMAGIEMIHSSSLVHDDLPCMDNDEYRRGSLTTWKKFGYDMGVLAGDDLLVEAFETASHALELGADPYRVVLALRMLGRQAGIFGMIGGQSVDVEMTGKDLSKEQLDFIYRKKTGALLEASLSIGSIMAGADESAIEEITKIASLIGVAFQIRDDILDVTSTTEILGKPVKSDEKNHKNTYVALYGLSEADRKIREYSSEAKERLIAILPQEKFLIQLFDYLIDRKQ